MNGLSNYIDMLIAYERLDGVIELAMQGDLQVEAHGGNRQLCHPFQIASNHSMVLPQTLSMSPWSASSQEK